MSWQIQWSFPAERTLLNLPWRDGARVDAAVLRFTETGKGDVYRLPTDNAITFRLRVRPYGIRLSYDREVGLLVVWSVYPLS